MPDVRTGYRSVFSPGLFAGQTVWVTGGGSGIGRCVAHELAALGAQVVISGRRVEKLEHVQAEITEDGGRCIQHAFDIRDEEAVKLANDSPYGLACSIWSQDIKRANRIARQVRVGITWINCWFLRDLRTPFGGAKQSGIGREGGVHSLEFYTELTNVCVKL